MLIVLSMNGKYIRALTNHVGEIVFHEEITEQAYNNYISKQSKH